MAERTRSDAIRDNILAIAHALNSDVSPKDCADQLTDIADVIGNCTLIDTKILKNSLKLMSAILWKMHYSEECNAVMEGYAIVLKDLLEQMAKRLEIKILDDKGYPLEDDGK